ncbi:MAG TPA: CBS domain-containing protein [Candidatus Polarisedimenticolia bacterium]|nr:CBS domain-containing protein [Candidatus Polarisedimenticolia bacterium]
MHCPDCGYDNIQGVFACEECGSDLAGLDIPGGQAMQGLKRHIMRDPLKRVGPLKPLVASPETTVWEAIRIMRDGRHGSVLVVDRGAAGQLVGIFTERDVLIRVWGSGLDINTTPLSAVMTPDPIVLREDDILAFAIHLMGVRGFRHIPIVRDDRPVGFVSVRGILRYIAEQVLTEE